MALVTTPARYQYRNDVKSWYTSSPQNVTQGTKINTWRSFGSGVDRVNRSSVPDWKDRIAKGLDASAPYLRDGHGFSVPRMGCLSTNVVGGTYRSQCELRWNGDVPDFSGYTSSVASDQAVARFKRKQAKLIDDFKALAPLAELRELRSLITGLSFTTESLVDALLFIKRTKGRAAFKFASEKWLQFSFGVSPMLNDIASLASAISAQFANNEEQILRSAGSAREERLVSWKSEASGPYGVSCYSTGYAALELSYRLISGYELHLNSENDYGAAERFGTRLPDLIPAVWEIMAYSWIFDYFTTMGSFLDDTFSADPSQVRYCVMNRRIRAKGQVLFEWRPNVTKGVILSSTVSPCTFDYFLFERSVYPSIPSRTLRFKTADEIGINAVNRLLNLSALLLPNIALKRRT